MSGLMLINTSVAIAVACVVGWAAVWIVRHRRRAKDAAEYKRELAACLANAEFIADEADASGRGIRLPDPPLDDGTRPDEAEGSDEADAADEADEAGQPEPSAVAVDAELPAPDPQAAVVADVSLAATELTKDVLHSSS
jgi:hypothetical protein